MKLRWTRAALLPLAPAAGVLLAVAGAGPVHATGTTLSVTGLLDGAGACAGTVCPTLRAAVLQANSDPANTYTINLPAGTFQLNGPSLPIESALTITGAGANKTTIQQTLCGSRVLTIDPDGTKTAQKPVTITGVTVTGGQVVGKEQGFSSGGGMVITDGALVTLNHDVVKGNGTNGNGGGISVHKDDSTLVVLDTIIKNNTAGAGIICEVSSPTPSIAGPDVKVTSAVADGGGIWSEGVLTMRNSTVNNNSATRNGGGLLLSPPAGATDTLSQVFIHHNSAMGVFGLINSGGGGIYDELIPGAHVAIDHSTISNNSTRYGSGGGDYEDFSTSPDIAKVATAVTVPALVTISSTTFSNNSALAGLGGALYVHDGANVLTTNDTITGNSARNGGGIAVGQATVKSHLGLEHDTIDANRASLGGPKAAGGLSLPDGATTIHNTIVVNNTVSPAQTALPAVLHNCAIDEGTLTSLGWNLADDRTCNLTHTGDQLPPSANAALGTLQDNGGVLDGANGATSPTLTQALGHGSTALDMADPVTFAAADERDVTRPQLAPASLLLVASSVAHVSVTPRADIGAYEAAQVAVTSTPTPSSGVAGIVSTPTPKPRSGVQGIISVPKTGANPDETLPLGATLAIAGLLSVAAGAFLARRRR
jgi:hypothetical protein